jgi:hypothetical protein
MPHRSAQSSRSPAVPQPSAPRTTGSLAQPTSGAGLPEFGSLLHLLDVLDININPSDQETHCDRARWHPVPPRPAGSACGFERPASPDVHHRWMLSFFTSPGCIGYQNCNPTASPGHPAGLTWAPQHRMQPPAPATPATRSADRAAPGLPRRPGLVPSGLGQRVRAGHWPGPIGPGRSRQVGPNATLTWLRVDGFARSFRPP